MKSTPFDLTGQTALITGGGTGLGFGMAKCFIETGARLVLVGRRTAELKKACAELGKNAFALPGDVNQTAQAGAMLDAAEQLTGPITILVNNAGVHLKKDALDTTDAEFAAVMQTHVFGAFALTREAARRMMARKSGNILFVASMASLFGIPKIIAYATAKTATLGLVRALAMEWGAAGVRVNAIAPGWIQSDMTTKALGNDPARKAKILGRTPLGQLGEAADIGWAAVYLCSPAGRFVTGAVLPVDGGASMGF
jgi:gluconate 5-dehydrogenase